MAVDLGNKSRRTKAKFHMVSEMEYKIIILEKNESLSTMEKTRLESLRQQKVLQEELGLIIQKTKKVPAEWVDGNLKSNQKGKIELELEGVEKTEIEKIGVTRKGDIEGKIIEASSKETEGTKEKDETETSTKIKQTFANAYLQFLQEKKASLRLEDPRAALDLASVRKEWKELEDKEPYKNLHLKRKKVWGEILGKILKQEN